MGNGIENLIFLLVALAAWAIKAALERKQAHKTPTRTTRRVPGSKPPARSRVDTGEVDLVVGRSPLPPAVTPRPRKRARESASAASLRESQPVRPAARRGRRRRGLGALAPTVAPDDLSRIEDRRLPPEVQSGLAPLGTATPMERIRLARRRRSVGLARLGMASLASRRRLVRAGVLWSEVLGMPRAITGPHRSPAARRASRG